MSFPSTATPYRLGHGGVMTLIVALLAAMVFLDTAAAETTLHPDPAGLCKNAEGLDHDKCHEALAGETGPVRAATMGAGGAGGAAPVLDTVSTYVWLGFIHILPRGYDHILFVLALFLAATSLRALLIQVAAFTVAHTITLGLAAAGFVSLSPDIIEPLIALSIAVVALENILFPGMTRWRPAVIFGFGLFHGLGFAGVLSELGLAGGQFLTSLVSFNIGVEFGQLAVIALAFVPAYLLRRALPDAQEETLYRRYVVIPGSALIALLGLYWFVSRLIFFTE